MLKNEKLGRVFGAIELLGVILTLALLPVDRFPYFHHVPLRLGAISFGLLLFAAAVRGLLVIIEKRWADLKRLAFISFIFLLPVIGYAQSIHYALDRPLATGATKLLLVVALKALCFFILLYENPRLWSVVKWTVYVVTALVVAFGFFQFIFDTFGASTKVTDLRSCCTSNSTYIFPRVHSVSIEPLYLDNFLLLPIWLMVYDLLFNKPARKSKWVLVLLVATCTLFLLSLARSAIFAFLVSFLAFIVAVDRKGYIPKLLPRAARTLAAIMMLTLLFVVVSGIASKHIHKKAINGSSAGVTGNLEIFSGHAVSVSDQSAQTRYSTWPKAVGFIKEHPVKGVGAYNSRVELNLSSYKKGVPDTQLQPFNNDMIGLLVDLGLIGIITFGPLVAAALAAIYKLFKIHWNHLAAPFALAGLAMLVQSNFFHSVLLARVWVTVGIALAGLFAAPGRPKRTSL